MASSDGPSQGIPGAVELNEEVFVSTGPVTKVSAGDIAFLKARAASNRRRRSRLCLHPGVDDPLHEMLIVHAAGAYVRPHKHLGKAESVHIIEGRMKIVIFDGQGAVTEVIALGPYAEGGHFCDRLAANTFHTVLPVSDVVVFHEATKGPFDRAETVFAPWAPLEDDLEAGARYIASLEQL